MVEEKKKFLSIGDYIKIILSPSRRSPFPEQTINALYKKISNFDARSINLFWI